jgi:ribulose-phosphate 3-epimerase
MLSADHGKMIEEVERVESWGVDWLHVDIMDGHFAPNLTFGPGMVKSIRSHARSTIDCHLMLSDPERFVSRFLDAGADYVTVHAEALRGDALNSIQSEVSSKNRKLGIAFKPATPLDVVDLVEAQPDMVLVMSVNPGFSGQKFMPEVIPKVSAASKKLSQKEGFEIEVDGGVDASNAFELVRSGATVLVAGNSIFMKPSPEEAYKELSRISGAGA